MLFKRSDDDASLNQATFHVGIEKQSPGDSQRGITRHFEVPIIKLNMKWLLISIIFIILLVTNMKREKRAGPVCPSSVSLLLMTELQINTIMPWKERSLN